MPFELKKSFDHFRNELTAFIFRIGISPELSGEMFAELFRQ